MADIFIRKVEKPLDGRDPLLAFERVEERMHAALGALPGGTSAEPFRCTDRHGSNFSRPSLADITRLIQEHNLELKFLYRLVNNQGDRSHENSTTVDTTLYNSSGRIEVEIRSTSQVVVNGLAKAAEEALDRMDSPVNGMASATVAPAHAEAGWLRRTWRDHTATFVSTVAGTVVAALLLAWVFGIGR